MSSSAKKRWTLALVGAFVASLAMEAPRAARAAETEGDPELRAREAFAAGRYEEAIGGYAKLYAKTLHPVYLRNIARCYQKKHDPQSAFDEFQDYLTKTKSGPYKISGEEREEIEGYIKDMRDEQARAAAPVAPLAAPAAPRALPAAPASQPATTLTATAPPPEDSHPIYARWWFWTILGVVAVGTATTILLTSGTSKPACTTILGCE